MKKIIALAGLVVAIGGIGWWSLARGEKSSASFRTVPVMKTDVRFAVKATGVLQPEEVVDVGAQVAGKIVSFGTDPRDPSRPIDYRTPVDENTILVKIDDSLYQSQVDQAEALVQQAAASKLQAEAQVESADANLQRAQADMIQLQARFDQADRDWLRAQQLEQQKTGVITQSDYDLSKANFETTKATLGIGRAAIAQAKSGVTEAKSLVVRAEAAAAEARTTLKRAKINLDYCTIRSPVKGEIIDRRVNVGQTVVSSLNSPSLFLIAKDLKKMQIWASVNEADVPKIRSGQKVRVTVEGFGGEVFSGIVAPDQPRYNVSMTQNVVNYTVVVLFDNSHGRFNPYSTANLEFQVEEKQDVLAVPNSALSWKPKPEQIRPADREEYTKLQARSKTPSASLGSDSAPQMVWTQDGAYVRMIPVRAGIGDGMITEVSGDGLQAGMELVAGELRRNADSDSSSPFTTSRIPRSRPPQ